MDSSSGGTQPMMQPKTILLSLIVLFILVSTLIFYPDYDSPRMTKFIIVTQVMFLISVLIYWVGRKFDFERADRRLFWLILSLAIVARVLMLVGADDKFYLSDDIYRYVWDGKVAQDGINPYLYSPLAPEVSHLVDTKIHPKINHAELPTIYPPVAQWLFQFAYVVGGDSTIAFKMVCALFELLTILALLVWLRRAKVERSVMLFYLFSPLILCEFYLSSHLDILGLPFLIAAFLAVQDRRPLVTGLMLALTTLVKFYGLLFVPFLLFHFKGKKRWLFLVSYIAVVIICYLPFVSDISLSALGSLGAYLQNWQFNASVFFLLRYGMGLEYAREIVALLFVGWALSLLLRRLDLFKKIHDLLAGYLILTTTLFPWYFVWIFPLILRYRSAAYFYLSGGQLLSYHVHISYYETGEWTPIVWLGVLAYLPFYLFLIVGWVKNIRRERKHA